MTCNRDATGSRVEISYQHQGKKIMQLREVVASNGLSAQGDHRLLFGLADYQGKVNVAINWCGKKKQTLVLTPLLYHSIEEKLN